MFLVLPFEALLPQVSHRQRVSNAIYSIFQICQFLRMGRIYIWKPPPVVQAEVSSLISNREWKLPDELTIEPERLAAALKEISVCLDSHADGGLMWRSYLFSARALGEFHSGNNEAAYASLLEAKGCIDKSTAAKDRDWQDRRRYDESCPQGLTYQYLWLCSRLVDLLETAQNWTALEEQLLGLLVAARDKPRTVFYAMLGIAADGDGHDTFWGGTYEASKSDSPLPLLRRKLAQVYTQLGKHEEAAKYAAS